MVGVELEVSVNLIQALGIRGWKYILPTLDSTAALVPVSISACVANSTAPMAVVEAAGRCAAASVAQATSVPFVATT